MQRFHKIEDSAVIVKARGTYYQRDAYRRGDELFVKHGSGFIRLFASPSAGAIGGGTSVPAISWVEMDLGSIDYSHAKGNPALLITENTKSLEAAE